MLNHKLLTAFLLGLIAFTIHANAASFADNLSVSPFAAFRADLDGGWDHGAGLDVGYDLNKHVTAHARALAYSNDDWRGSAIDEVSGLVEAKLLKSSNGGVTLSAIGGVDGDIVREDIGLSVGLRGDVKLSKNVSLFAEGRYRAWRENADDVPTAAGIQFKF
jgi:hypothetical protein